MALPNVYGTMSTEHRRTGNVSGRKELVPEEGVEPTRSKAPADFESAASASSATPGLLPKLTCPALPLKRGRAASGRYAQLGPIIGPQEREGRRTLPLLCW
jgi:hypothetical protein